MPSPHRSPGGTTSTAAAARGQPAAPAGPRRVDGGPGGLVDGPGSWGNGAAMRVAPPGAFFAGDPAEAAWQAALSATVTHTHPEAVAGAIAAAHAVPLTIWAAARQPRLCR